jgi:hypothetical protein
MSIVGCQSVYVVQPLSRVGDSAATVLQLTCCSACTVLTAVRMLLVTFAFRP